MLLHMSSGTNILADFLNRVKEKTDTENVEIRLSLHLN